VVWRTTAVADGIDVPSPPRWLRGNAWLAALTSAACLVAAVGEGWRYALLVRGRDWVLSGAQVRANDALLTWTGLAALLLGIGTAWWTIVNLVALHRGAAVRQGWAPARGGAGIVSRLVIPGWNVYGAGQIMTEVDAELAEPPDPGPDGVRGATPAPVPSGAPRPSTIVWIWWVLWVLNAVLVLVTLVTAFWRSIQAMANTVEWHIAVDLSAAAVAGVLVGVLIRFERRWSGRGPSELAGWSVAPPPSTPGNRRTGGPAVGACSPPVVRDRPDRSEGDPQHRSGDGIEPGEPGEGAERQHDALGEPGQLRPG
jgi:hypothetical protein